MSREKVERVETREKRKMGQRETGRGGGVNLTVSVATQIGMCVVSFDDHNFRILLMLDCHNSLIIAK